MYLITLALIAVLACGRVVSGEAGRNATKLLLEENFVGPVAEARGDTSVLMADTPIAVRYALIFTVLDWNFWALCDPSRTALNFWGEAVYLPKAVCDAENTPGELNAYGYMRAAEAEFTVPAQKFAQVMRQEGYDPQDRSTDQTTAIGMGNYVGTRLARMLAHDGWNAQGEWSRRHNRQPFDDYTGYAPVNPVQQLRFPFRWQPLMETGPSIGRFYYQKHVIPQLGRVRPLLLSTEELVSRFVKAPYRDMNATELVGEDAEYMDELVREVVDTSANLTPQQKFLARWWENKFTSTGIFATLYMHMLQFDRKFMVRWGLGEMLAMHDATVLAWKEKRRHDAVRPKTIIQHFYKNETFEAFEPVQNEVVSMVGRDWEPLIGTQPHSEYPSASSCICTAFADHGTEMLKEYAAETGMASEPPLTYHTKFNILPLETDGIEHVLFNSLEEAGRTCGDSRLWAGVHFSPSILAGRSLGSGLGQMGYDFVKELAEGRVPSNCWWCGETS